VRLRGVVFPIKNSLFNRKLHNRFQRVLCSCTQIAQQYKALDGFKMEHVKVLLEGVDTQRFKPATSAEKSAARQKFQLHPTAFYFGTAGRPAPVKGHLELVRAFGQAAPNLKEHVRLAIFCDESRRGGGSYRVEEMRTLIEAQGVSSRVDFRAGFVEDMREVYHALDLYALPSLGSEGSSRAGLEACASGLPLLASSVGALPDLVLERVTGELVEPGNIGALSAALIEYQNPEFAREQGQAARQRMEAHFQESDYARRLADELTAARALLK
jgi:glycosyltransferase involved in cell wall biosynthesis